MTKPGLPHSTRFPGDSMTIHITIDDRRLVATEPSLTGRNLKALAGLPADVTLFAMGSGEDRVLTDDASIALNQGMRLFSLPAAAYGGTQSASNDHHAQPQITIHINRTAYHLDNPIQTGRALKLVAGLPLEDVLFLDRRPDDVVVANDSVVTLRNGEHLHSQVPATYGTPSVIHIFINKVRFEIHRSVLTGLALKTLAGIESSIVLFLESHPDDVVIANDAEVTLSAGAHLHSQLPGDYGLRVLSPDDRPRDRHDEYPQPDGWLFVIMRDVRLPLAYSPDRADILIKLPPLFPDAAPDMFWTTPAVALRSGGAPQNTSMEQVLDKPWLRFSWHLSPGAWKPGISTLQDFIRCIRGRLERGN